MFLSRCVMAYCTSMKPFVFPTSVNLCSSARSVFRRRGPAMSGFRSSGHVWDVGLAKDPEALGVCLRSSGRGFQCHGFWALVFVIGLGSACAFLHLHTSLAQPGTFVVASCGGSQPAGSGAGARVYNIIQLSILFSYFSIPSLLACHFLWYFSARQVWLIDLFFSLPWCSCSIAFATQAPCHSVLRTTSVFAPIGRPVQSHPNRNLATTPQISFRTASCVNILNILVVRSGFKFKINPSHASEICQRFNVFSEPLVTSFFFLPTHSAHQLIKFTDRKLRTSTPINVIIRIAKEVSWGIAMMFQLEITQPLGDVVCSASALSTFFHNASSSKEWWTYWILASKLILPAPLTADRAVAVWGRCVCFRHSSLQMRCLYWLE